MADPREERLPNELDEGFRATFERLRRTFRARGVPAEEAADLAQETITRALLHVTRHGARAPYPNDNGSHGIAPLINRIAANLLIDRARAAGPQLVSIDGAEAIAEPEQDPSEIAERRHRRSVVWRHLDELPSRHRRAITLSLDGLSPAEIAGELGIARNAADALLYRARRRLADRLSAVGRDLHAFAFLIAFRIRSTSRRAAETADATLVAAAQGSFAILAAGLLSLGALPGAVANSTVADRPPAQPVTAVGGAANVAAAADVGPAPAGTTTIETTQQGLGARLDPRDHSVELRTSVQDPRGHDRGPLGVRAWHDREEERGTVGPLLDEVSDRTCDTAEEICEEPSL